MIRLSFPAPAFPPTPHSASIPLPHRPLPASMDQRNRNNTLASPPSTLPKTSSPANSNYSDTRSQTSGSSSSTTSRRRSNTFSVRFADEPVHTSYAYENVQRQRRDVDDGAAGGGANVHRDSPSNASERSLDSTGPFTPPSPSTALPISMPSHGYAQAPAYPQLQTQPMYASGYTYPYPQQQQHQYQHQLSPVSNVASMATMYPTSPAVYHPQNTQMHNPTSPVVYTIPSVFPSPSSPVTSKHLPPPAQYQSQVQPQAQAQPQLPRRRTSSQTYQPQTMSQKHSAAATATTAALTSPTYAKFTPSQVDADSTLFSLPPLMVKKAVHPRLAFSSAPQINYDLRNHPRNITVNVSDADASAGTGEFTAPSATGAAVPSQYASLSSPGGDAMSTTPHPPGTHLATIGEPGVMNTGYTFPSRRPEPTRRSTISFSRTPSYSTTTNTHSSRSSHANSSHHTSLSASAAPQSVARRSSPRPISEVDVSAPATVPSDHTIRLRIRALHSGYGSSSHSPASSLGSEYGALPSGAAGAMPIPIPAHGHGYEGYAPGSYTPSSYSSGSPSYSHTYSPAYTASSNGLSPAHHPSPLSSASSSSSSSRHHRALSSQDASTPFLAPSSMGTPSPQPLSLAHSSLITFPFPLTLSTSSPHKPLTIESFLEGLYTSLRTVVTGREMRTCDERLKVVAEAAWARRTNSGSGSAEDGKEMRRVDFLGEYTAWCGLALAAPEAAAASGRKGAHRRGASSTGTDEEWFAEGLKALSLGDDGEEEEEVWELIVRRV